MHSEFYSVSLDRIRYSLVWEDSTTLYGALDIAPNDRVLVITSAGCNVLNALLNNPLQVIAVDLNPVQNKLLRFKKHLILHYDHALFRGLMGFDGVERVSQCWQEVAPTLPSEMKEYWQLFFESHPAGILTAGRLETYLTGFFRTLDKTTQAKLLQLIQFDEVSPQYDFFLRELHEGAFKEVFIEYFDDTNLSKGRDPKLFKYAEESGGEAFYRRLVRHVSSVLVKDNFFFRFLFFGPEKLPESILPPCYQQKNLANLKEQLSKLTIVDGEAVDYLLSAEGLLVNKASLSNVFEYTSHEEFGKVCELLLAKPERKLRFVFWNLLQEQGNVSEAEAWRDIPLPPSLSQQDACFYFRNVRVKESISVSVSIK